MSSASPTSPAGGPAAEVPGAPAGQRAETLVAGRYRLQAPRAQRPGADLWLARDEVLDRPVAVRLVAVAGPAAVVGEAELTAAVSRAGGVADARFARLLDVTALDLDDGRLVAVVGEWVAAPTLVAVLRERRLPVEEAVDLAYQVACGTAAAHAAGARHGRLHPGNVLLPASGRVRVTDLEVAALVAGGDRPDPVATERADVAALGGLLYAALTGRWPLAGTTALPAAAEPGHAVPPPRRLRPGIRREVDATAVGLLEAGRRSGAGAPTAATVVRRLEPLPRRQPLAPPDPAQRDRWRRAVRRWTVRIVPALVVAAVAVLGWRAGHDLGEVRGAPRAAPSPASPSAGTSGPALVAIPLTGAVHDYDPEGDGSENPSAVPLAVDGDPSTAWETSHYTGNPVFGGLKQGVGLLVDLGSAQSVREVRLQLTRPGADVELRVAASRPTGIGSTSVVARATHTGTAVTLTPRAGSTGRYWVVWFTRLAPDGSGRYAEGVVEMQFLRAAGAAG